MTLYIFDTDHLSLYGRNHPVLIQKLQQNSIALTTTAINVEEQVRGRLAQVIEACVPSSAEAEASPTAVAQRHQGESNLSLKIHNLELNRSL